MSVCERERERETNREGGAESMCVCVWGGGGGGRGDERWWRRGGVVVGREGQEIEKREYTSFMIVKAFSRLILVDTHGVTMIPS